jgi:hypothetical protein
MPSHHVEPIRTTPTEGRTRRVAARPGAVSTKAMLTSLLGLSALAAGALFLMHSLVGSDPSASRRLGVTELQATEAPIEIPPPPSQTPAPTLTPVSAGRNAIPTPSAILAPPRAVPATPLSRPRPKPKAAPPLLSENPFDTGP